MLKATLNPNKQTNKQTNINMSKTSINPLLTQTVFTRGKTCGQRKKYMYFYNYCVLGSDRLPKGNRTETFLDTVYTASKTRLHSGSIKPVYEKVWRLNLKLSPLNKIIYSYDQNIYDHYKYIRRIRQFGNIKIGCRGYQGP